MQPIELMGGRFSTLRLSTTYSEVDALANLSGMAG